MVTSKSHVIASAEDVMIAVHIIAPAPAEAFAPPQLPTRIDRNAFGVRDGSVVLAGLPSAAPDLIAPLP